MCSRCGPKCCDGETTLPQCMYVGIGPSVLMATTLIHTPSFPRALPSQATAHKQPRGTKGRTHLMIRCPPPVPARGIARVPNSRLILKNKPFACPVIKSQWMDRLVSLGVDAWRIELLPLTTANADHLAQYALMDISLDPFPYAGLERHAHGNDRMWGRCLSQ
jgi:hypothetical protein